MFSDPFTSVMVLIMLSFIGVTAMFFFGLRSLSVLQKNVHDRQMELENALLELEQRLTNRILDASRLSHNASRSAVAGEESGKLFENVSRHEPGERAWPAAGGNGLGASRSDASLPPLVDEPSLSFPKGASTLSLTRGKREPFSQGPDGLTLK